MGQAVSLLFDVYDDENRYQVLFNLLATRKPRQAISHKAMPPWEQHVEFVDSRPYAAWYLIECEDAGDKAYRYVGACYLTTRREVGLFLFPFHRGKGWGRRALEELRRLHPGPLLANIAPRNTESADFFMDAGFRKIQETYAVD